jgi:hypothetical protein
MSKSIYDPKLIELWRDRALDFKLSDLEHRRRLKAKPAIAVAFNNASKKTQRVGKVGKKRT